MGKNEMPREIWIDSLDEPDIDTREEWTYRRKQCLGWDVGYVRADLFYDAVNVLREINMMAAKASTEWVLEKIGAATDRDRE